jgi:hypothetical protein
MKDSNVPWSDASGSPETRLIGGELFLAALIALSGCETKRNVAVDWITSSDTSATIVLKESKNICADCIELTKIVTLGADTSQGFTRPSREVIRDSLGRYWVGQRRQIIKVFDSSGGFVKAVGRRGKGPGEFVYSSPIDVDGSGNIHIFDAEMRRETIIGPDFVLRSVRPFPSGTDAAWAAAIPGRDEFVFADPFYAPTERIGPALFIVRGSDTIRSIGPAISSPPKTPVSPQIISADTGRRIYSVRFMDYTIEVFSYEGRRIGTFLARELNPPQSSDDPAAQGGAVNHVIAIRADGTGLVWVLSKWLRENWRDHYTLKTFEGGHQALVRTDSLPEDSIYSTRIDVIDLREREIVATKMVDGLFESFVGPDLVQNITTDDGLSLIALWGARFKRK